MEQRGTEKQRQDDFTGQIIAACIEVHRHLGPGLLESAYEHCLARELGLRGFRTQRQVAIPLQYKGIDLDCGYRLDLMVEGRLVVEVKAVEQLLPVHLAQSLPISSSYDCRWACSSISTSPYFARVSAASSTQPVIPLVLRSSLFFPPIPPARGEVKPQPPFQGSTHPLFGSVYRDETRLQ